MTDREDDEHREQANPAENTDAATKADAGLTGTPAQAYSPEGMDDGAHPGDDGSTYQPDDD